MDVLLNIQQNSAEYLLKQIEDTQTFLLGYSWTGTGKNFFESLAVYLYDSLGVDYVCIDKLIPGGLEAQTVAVYFDGQFEDNVRYSLEDTPCGKVSGQQVCCFPHKVRHLFPNDIVLQEMVAESYAGITLWSSEGIPIGLIAVISRKPLTDTKLTEIVLKQVSIRAASELDHSFAEEAIRKNQENHKVIIESAMDGFWLTDRDGNFLEVNAAYCTMSGYSKDELLNMNISDIDGLETINETISRINKIAKKGEDRFESVHKRKDESVFIVEVNVQYRDNDGGQFVTFLHDITKRKKTESLLQINNSRLNLAMSVANMAWWEMNIVTDSITFENRKAEMLGYSAENFTHFADFMKLVHPEDAKNAMEAMRRHIYGSVEKYEVEYRIRTKSGKYKWFYDIGSVTTRDANGKSLFITGLVTDISERKETERTLIVSEERFRLALKDSHINVSQQDVDLRYNWIYNPELGYSPEEVLGKSDIDLLPLEVVNQITPIKKQVLSTGKTKKTDTSISTPQGIHYFDFTISPLFDAANKIIGITNVEIDITERKSMEQQLHFQADVLQSVTDAVIVTDLSYNITSWNKPAECMYGWNAEEVLGRFIRDIVQTQTDGEKLNQIYQTIKDGQTIITEHIQKTKAGNLINVECNSMPLVDSIGKNVGYVTINRNITERKLAEQALRESEERYKSLFQNNYSVMLLIHPETGEILDANPAAITYYGWSKAEICSRKISEINMLSPKEVAAEMHKAKEEERNQFFFKHKLASGEIRDVEVYSGPIQFGETVMLYSLVHDITDRKIAEEALRESQERISTVINSIADTFYSLDEEWRLTAVNPAAERAPFGRPASELLGSVIWELFPNLVGTRIHQHYIDAAAKHCLEQYISQSPLNGLWYEVFMQGRKGGVDVYMRDVTDKKQAEEALMQSEARYKSMFQDNQSTLLIIDPDTGDIKDANPAACEFYGWSFEEFCQKNISEINAVLSKEEISINLRNSKEFKNNHLFFKHKLASGELRDVEVYSGPITFGESTLIYTIVHDITDRKLAEEALQSSERRMDAVFNGVTETIMLMDITGNVLMANRTAADRWGMTLENIIGYNGFEYVHPDLKKKRELQISEMIENRSPIRFEEEWNDTIFDLTFYPIIEPSGEINQFIIFNRDITKARKNEQSLRESEDRFRLALNNSPVSVAIQDENFIYVWAYNQSTRENDDIIGKTDTDLFDAEIIPEITEVKRRVLETGSEEHVQMWLNSNGHRLFLDLHYEPLKDQAGKTTGIGIAVVDMTNQKLAEEALKATERRLDAVFNGVKETILLLDINGTVLISNQTAAERWGLSVEDIIGYNVFEYSDPAMRAKRELQVSEMIETRLPIQFEEPFNDKIFDLTFYPIIEPTGEIKQFVIIHRDVTEVKKAAQALLESGEKFRTLIWDMQVGVLLQGPHAEILMSNPKALELLGLTEDQLLGKTSFDPDWNVIHEDGTPFPGETHPVAVAIATGESVMDVVMGVYNPSIDKRLWLLVHAVPEFDLQGNIQQVVCTFIDITELKKAEKAVKESEEKFRNLVFDMEVGVLLNNPNSEIILANPKAMELLGLTEDQITGKTPFDPDWRPIHEDGSPFPGETHPAAVVIATCKAVKNVVMGIYQPLRGDHAWFLINAQPQLDNNGVLLQVVTTFVEISDLREAQRELKESELRLKFHFENSPLGVVEWDKDFVVTQWSGEAEKIFGYAKEEVIGKPIGDLNLIFEEDLPIVNNTMQRLSSGEEDTLVITNRNVTKSGSIIHVVWYNSILFDENGKMKSVMSLVEDITAKKQVEETLIESEYLFRESQRAAFIGSYKTNFKTGHWESSEVMDQIFGIDNTYEKSVEGWLDIIHPDDRDMMNEYLYDEVVGKRLPFNKEYRILRKNDGEMRWIHGMGKVGFDENNNLISLVGTIQDIHDRKLKEDALRKLNKTLAALSKSSQIMAQTTDEAEYLNKVCDIIVDDTDFTMVWIGYAEEDEAKTIRPVASAGFNDDYLDNVKISWADNEFGCGPSGVAVRTGKMAMCNNMFTDPDFEPWRDQALKRGFAASIVFPLKSGNKTFGAITIYAKEPDSFLEDEIKLLSKLSSDLAHGIITIRLRKAQEMAELALHKSHSELSVLVEERTAELVEINRTLSLTEEKYRTIADFTYNMETWMDASGKYIYVSPSCLKITGYTADEFMNDPNLFVKIAHPDDCEMVENHFKEDMTGTVLKGALEFRIITKSGMERWIGHSCQPVYSTEGMLLGQRGSNRNITKQKIAELILVDSEKHLRALTQRMDEVAEEERIRISREIHDEIGHLLTALKYDTEGLTNHLNNKPEQIKEELSGMISMIDALIDTVRKIATELRPGILDHMGLLAAIEWKIKQFRLKNKICCEYDIEEMDVVFTKNETTFIYRILQEIFTNVTRHSKATHLLISIGQNDGNFVMKVTDNGVGFDVQASLQKGSLGLMGIRERAKSIGGEIQIESFPGKGTITTFILKK